MSVTQQSTVTTHTATGSTAVFAYGFRILSAADLVVEVNGAALTLGVDYTVSGVGAANGGGVTLTGGVPAAGVTVRLRRATRLERGTDYQSGGDFLAAVVNADFDRAIMALQDLFHGSSGPGNSLRAPAGEFLPELPAAPQRINTQLLFGSQGQPYIGAPASGSAADVLLQLADETDSTKGDALVAVKYSAPQAVALNLHDWIEDDGSYNVMGFVPQNVKAAIRARTSTTDISGAFESCIAALVSERTFGCVSLPMGAMAIEAPIVPRFGISIIGAGGRASLIRCYDTDGIAIQAGTWDQNMAVYRDFGLTAMSGLNRTGFRCATVPYAGEQDGFHLHNLQFFDWDTSIYFGSCWQSNIVECWIERTNTGIRLDGHAVLNNIERCQIIRTGGGRGSALNRGVIFGTNDIEANNLLDNFVFGFQRCVELGEPWFCQVVGNTFLAAATPGAAMECLTFSTVKEKLLVTRNIFEGAPGAGSAFTAVSGAPLNTASGGSATIALNRFFDDTSAGSGSIGLKLNDVATTNQNNVHVYDNNFIGFSTADIRVDNPNNVVLRDNDCHSTAATNSIVVQGAITAPVRVLDNSCKRPLSLDATALANGSLQARGNSDSGVFTPDEVYNQAWTPANASADSVALTVNSARWNRAGKLHVVQLDITWPATSGSAAARVSLPAAPAAVYSGGCGYTTYGTQALAWMTSAGAANFVLYDALGNPLTNASMSGKRVTATITFTTP